MSTEMETSHKNNIISDYAMSRQARHHDGLSSYLSFLYDIIHSILYNINILQNHISFDAVARY